MGLLMGLLEFPSVSRPPSRDLWSNNDKCPCEGQKVPSLCVRHDAVRTVPVQELSEVPKYLSLPRGPASSVQRPGTRPRTRTRSPPSRGPCPANCGDIVYCVLHPPASFPFSAPCVACRIYPGTDIGGIGNWASTILASDSSQFSDRNTLVVLRTATQKLVSQSLRRSILSVTSVCSLLVPMLWHPSLHIHSR